MIFIKWLISLVWGGGGTVTAILKEIDQTRVQMANTQVESDKVHLQNRLDTLHALLEDEQGARQAAAALPWWGVLIACMIGLPLALHVALIGLGTSFAPLIVSGPFDWMLHIPGLPKPFGDYEAQVIGYFFGSVAFLGGASVIAGAIGRRK